jgi:hypothetical protein
MNPACDHYLEDPEANAEHLRECESCRALFGGLEQRPVEPRPIAHRELPLAPWEGAAHRAWPLVVGGALAVLALALSLFVTAGISSASGIVDAIKSSMPPLGALMTMFSSIAQTSGSWQIAIVIAFVAVNALLVLLLRRSPRGIDG